MISTKQDVDFATYHKKQLVRFCKKFHKDCYRLVGQKMALKDKVAELEQQIEKMKCCENCIHHSFWGNELKCNLMSYDDEFECLKTKSKWELDVK